MSIPMITIDMDKKCAECRKGGAADNGICLKCTTKAMGATPMKSAQGRRVQAAWKALMAMHSGRPSSPEG